MAKNKIKALFLDVGGVLLTNGWDHVLRKKTADHFQIDFEEMEKRHILIFNIFEVGEMSFDEYLHFAIFNKTRSFTLKDIKDYIFNAVQPHQDMLDYVKKIKKEYGLKIGLITNEGRELAEDRYRRFDFESFSDFFIVSGCVGYRKPDHRIYRLALDLFQIPPENIAYIDDRLLLIEIGGTLGLKAIQHKNLETTKKELENLIK